MKNLLRKKFYIVSLWFLLFFTILLHLISHLDDPSINPLVGYEKALSYILYLVDVSQLFEIALGLYDFQMVVMVAEKSQKVRLTFIYLAIVYPG